MEEPKILHVIDGIAEYDNPIPGWLLTLLWATIVFSVVYWVLYPSWFGPGLLKWSQYKQYNQEMADAAKLQASAPDAAAGGIAALIGHPDAIAAGKAIFTQNCAACHGANAEGGIGPNLQTPPYWAYGSGKPEEIEHIVLNGTQAGGTAKGGMPAWGSILGKAKVDQAVAYVYSLQHPEGH